MVLSQHFYLSFTEANNSQTQFRVAEVDKKYIFGFFSQFLLVAHIMVESNGSGVIEQSDDFLVGNASCIEQCFPLEGIPIGWN